MHPYLREPYIMITSTFLLLKQSVFEHFQTSYKFTTSQLIWTESLALPKD